jgi:predicted dehydrogenase
MKLRVGVVGLGKAWENRHRPALRALSDRFEVRAFCEQVAHRADQAAREFGAAAVDGFRALAHREDIDAILMLSRQWYGALPIFAACDAGKAIYCATGLDLDPAQARHIRQRVYESGVAFMAEFSRRQAPATLRLKELIATRLGQPRLLFSHLRVALKDAPRHVFANRERGPVNDLIELVDWCSYVVGHPPTSVIGLSHREPSERSSFDYEMMSLDFSPPGQWGEGPVAQISCGRYMPNAWPEAVSFRPPAALQVACENGIAFIDLPSTLVWFDRAGRHMESLENERPVGEQLLSQFYRSVTSLVRNSAGLDDAFRALSIVMTARESHSQGQRLPIET